MTQTVFDPQNPTDEQASIARLFRIVAIAEAVSWGLLLVAMFFKWIVQDDPNAGLEGGVPIAGPIHGVVFIAYVLLTLRTAWLLRWSRSTLLLALASSIPPFMTAWFEVRAARRGALPRASR